MSQEDILAFLKLHKGEKFDKYQLGEHLKLSSWTISHQCLVLATKGEIQVSYVKKLGTQFPPRHYFYIPS